jgi:hypothetical protein
VHCATHSAKLATAGVTAGALVLPCVGSHQAPSANCANSARQPTEEVLPCGDTVAGVYTSLTGPLGARTTKQRTHSMSVTQWVYRRDVGAAAAAVGLASHCSLSDAASLTARSCWQQFVRASPQLPACSNSRSATFGAGKACPAAGPGMMHVIP